MKVRIFCHILLNAIKLTEQKYVVAKLPHSLTYEDFLVPNAFNPKKIIEITWGRKGDAGRGGKKKVTNTVEFRK